MTNSSRRIAVSLAVLPWFAEGLVLRSGDHSSQVPEVWQLSRPNGNGIALGGRYLDAAGLQRKER